MSTREEIHDMIQKARAYGADASITLSVLEALNDKLAELERKVENIDERLSPVETHCAHHSA